MEIVSGNKLSKHRKVHFTRSAKTKSLNRNHSVNNKNRLARSNSLRNSFKNNNNNNKIKNNINEINNIINNNGNHVLQDEVCLGEFTR